MAEKCTDRQGVDPRLQHPRREAVPEVVQTPFGPVPQGQACDPLASLANRSIVCLPDLRIKPLGLGQSLELGRRQAQFRELESPTGEPEPAEPAVESARIPRTPIGVAKQRPL